MEPASGVFRSTGWLRLSINGPRLLACHLAGLDPVAVIGKVHLSDVEKVRLLRLLEETVNDVVLEHAAVISDLATFRAAAPACLGFSVVHDDVRARELVGAIQRHSGKTVDLPTDAAMTSTILDAMVAADVPPEEREFFKFIATASFYAGAGAGLEDVVRMSVQRPE
jgi:hypothetical protein